MRSLVIQDSYECSPQQTKEYIRFKILGNQGFNHTLVFEYKGLDREALDAALVRISERHESLRTTFFLHDDSVRQRIHPNVINRLEYHDLRGRSMVELQKAYHDLTSYRFNFEERPPVRFNLARYSNDVQFLLVTLHHIISDANSLVILRNEINALYDAFRKKLPDPLEPLNFHCKEYAHWVNEYLNSENGIEEAQRYVATLRDSIKDEFDADGSNLSSVSYKKQLAAEIASAVGEENSSRFKYAYGNLVNLFPAKGAGYRFFIEKNKLNRSANVALRARVTLNTALITAFVILLFKENGKRNQRVYIPFGGRPGSEFEGIVGWLACEMIASFRIDASQPVRKVIDHVSDVMLELSDHRFYPHERILNDLDVPLSTLAPAFVNILRENGNYSSESGPAHDDDASGHFNLRCEMLEWNNGLEIVFNYNTSVYSKRDIERLAARLTCILETVTLESNVADLNC